MVDGTGHITAACSRNPVRHLRHLILDCMLLFTSWKQFIIAQRIRSSPMLFLDPVAMYISTYVRRSLPNLYGRHLPLCQPNVLSSDGSVSLSTSSYSRNGKWFAYALSRSVRHHVAVTVQDYIVSVGKRLHRHLHSLHRASIDRCRE